MRPLQLSSMPLQTSVPGAWPGFVDPASRPVLRGVAHAHAGALADAEQAVVAGLALVGEVLVDEPVAVVVEAVALLEVGRRRHDGGDARWRGRSRRWRRTPCSCRPPRAMALSCACSGGQHAEADDVRADVGRPRPRLRSAVAAATGLPLQLSAPSVRRMTDVVAARRPRRRTARSGFR